MKAMILAAGLGTRLGSLTTHKPKALVEINGITLLENAITYLKSFGINEIIINVHHHADQIIHFLEEKKKFGINISISDERNELLDTGGGLLKAAHFFGDGSPFIVYNVDVLSRTDLNKLLNYHYQHNGLATLVVKKRQTSRYFLADDNHLLCGWRNTNTGEEIIIRHSAIYYEAAFSGIQIVSPMIFEFCSLKGKFSLTELYLSLASKHNIFLFWDDAIWFDLGKPENINEAEKFFSNL